jgi:YD repeat-containing protein
MGRQDRHRTRSFEASTRLWLDDPAADTSGVLSHNWRTIQFLVLASTAALSSAVTPCEGAGQATVPPASSVAVYFVPIGLVSADRIADLQRYYRDSLRLKTAVLPTFTPSRDAWNPRLLHWRAETLVQELIEHNERLLRSGKVLVIGITGDDLQSVEDGWVFGWRTGARTAIVSSARMEPAFNHEEGDESVLATRLRKMVTRYIGTLYYDMPASRNPESPVYGSIDGLRALDRMGTSLGDAESMRLRPLLDYREAVNLQTGIFIHADVDLVLEDTPRVMFRRAYQSRDTQPRGHPFGIGSSHSFATFLVGDAPAFSFIDLLLEDGARVHYRRVSPGTGVAGSIFAHDEQDAFAGSRLSWQGRDWLLLLKDGSSYRHPDCSPLAARPCTVTEYRDPAGRRIRMAFDSNNNVATIESEAGHIIRLHYDDRQRIALAWDDSGKSVSYEYDGRDRLIRATDSDGRVKQYEYDGLNRMVHTHSADLDETMAYDSRGLCVRYERRGVRYVDAAGHKFDRQAVFTFEYTTGAKGEVLGGVVASTGPDGPQRLAFDQHGRLMPPVTQKTE